MPRKDSVDQLISEVITALLGAKSSPTKDTMLYLMNYMAGIWKAMYRLDEHAVGDEKATLSNSFAVLTRSMFDAYLQAAFVAQEDTEARAQLYLNFQHVELYQQAMKAVKQSNDISKSIAESPLRECGEKRLKKQYDSVVREYTGNNGKVRAHWYEGNLGNLAKAVDKYDEYFWYTQRFNSAVHAGPLAAWKGYPVDEFLAYAEVLMSRIASIVVEQNGLNISPAAVNTIDELAVSTLTSID